MGESQVSSNFPVSIKKALPVVIMDTFENIREDNTDFLLSQIDASEKNEKDILRVVSSKEKEDVPVPDIKNVEGPNVFLSSGVFFEAPDRCFNFDKDYFEPPTYNADKSDLLWIEEFNKNHKFLKISVKDLEYIFNIIESIVKDGVYDDPKLPQVLSLVSEPAPAYAVISALYEHWREKDKQYNSAVSYREFPPDHCHLRQSASTAHRSANKIRKQLNDNDYLKRLRKELKEIQRQRAEALRVLKAQEERQFEDEIFVRQAMRKFQKNSQSISMICLPKPTPKHEFDVVNQPTSVTSTTLPEPPSHSSFLQWCLKQTNI
ncbi:hypothetical protein GPJ56_002628 [Histomonas meleagridis]|uniref:uncharacterized protein n=1 Tax=Histomonas meleagridis TaxID=135588 RepID=UPI00355A20F0|nr:hypothetical protein GPJ56_002628 [Histomonas meleagridis]KAH0801427.1 hypothetical protein GO595_006022 [Histomonas meleagridis]